MIERLKADHARIRELCGHLAALLAEERIGDVAALMQCRWQLTREILLHLPVEERYVYAPLERNGGGSRVAASRRDLDALYAMFKRHVGTWDGDRVVAAWDEYRAAVPPLLGRLVARMDREERELYPLVGARSLPVAPLSHNWAGDAWTLRTAILKQA